MDKDMKLWLIDVKNSPLLLLKEKEMVLEMFKYIFKLNEIRNSKLYDVFRKHYAEIVQLIKQGTLDLNDHQAFLTGLKNHFVFKKESDQVRAAMRTFSDYLNIHPSFELLYDGRIGYDLLSTPSLEVERFKLKLRYSKIDNI